MAVYPVFIPKQNTLFVDGTKTSINAKMKSLGIKNFSIGKIVPKAKLGLVKNIIKPGSIKKPAPKGSGLGRTFGDVNNPGMKIESSKGKGPTLTADKKDAIVQKVKNKNPKIPKSRILSWIAKNPVKSAAIGTSAVAAAILASLSIIFTPSKLADATLPKSKPKKKLDRGVYKAPAINGKQKDKSKSSSSVSVIIETPISKPKSNNKKKKIDKSIGSKSKSAVIVSLITGGKGTTTQRMKEITAEKKLEKKLGRRPSKKELINYMGKKI